MRRYFYVLAVVVLAAFVGTAVAQGNKGQPITASQAATAKDGSLVTITGYIVADLGSRKFTFRDDTGEIRVDVGIFDGAVNKQLKALKPTDRVEIFGDVHNENVIHVHAKKVTRL